MINPYEKNAIETERAAAIRALNLDSKMRQAQVEWDNMRDIDGANGDNTLDAEEQKLLESNAPSKPVSQDLATDFQKMIDERDFNGPTEHFTE